MPDETANVELARVESRQMPIFSRDLRRLASEIHLDWLEARRLWDAGFLSFDPDTAVAGDEAREAEFIFVGSLAAVGLPHTALEVLLHGLQKPYAYDIGRIFFDWRARRWRLLQGQEEVEEAFFALLGRLDARREAQVLLEIRELVENALDLARGRRHLFGHESPVRVAVVRETSPRTPPSDEDGQPRNG